MLVPNQQEINLGDLKFGQTYHFQYQLKNTATEPVNIVKLVLGCSSCTTAEINKNMLIPGETAILKAHFTPGSTGMNNKNISVAYNVNGVPMTLSLKFKSNVGQD